MKFNCLIWHRLQILNARCSYMGGQIRIEISDRPYTLALPHDVGNDESLICTQTRSCGVTQRTRHISFGIPILVIQGSPTHTNCILFGRNRTLRPGYSSTNQVFSFLSRYIIFMIYIFNFPFDFVMSCLLHFFPCHSHIILCNNSRRKLK